MCDSLPQESPYFAVQSNLCQEHFPPDKTALAPPPICHIGTTGCVTVSDDSAQLFPLTALERVIVPPARLLLLTYPNIAFNYPSRGDRNPWEPSNWSIRTIAARSC